MDTSAAFDASEASAVSGALDALEALDVPGAWDASALPSVDLDAQKGSGAGAADVSVHQDVQNAGTPPGDAASSGPPTLGEPSRPVMSHVLLAGLDQAIWTIVGDWDWSETRRLGEPPGSGALETVEAQSVGPVVHVAVLRGGLAYSGTSDGKVVSGWSVFPIGAGVDLGLANWQGRLAVCLLDANGSLHISTRLEGDLWSPPADVTALITPEPPQSSRLVKVDCAGVDDRLEVVAIDAAGRLWHARRLSTGWTRARQILGAPEGLRALDLSNAVGTVHLAAGGRTTLYTADLLRNEETWSGFWDVQLLYPYPFDPLGDPVSTSQSSRLSTVSWLQLTDRGELFHSVQYNPAFVWNFHLLREPEPNVPRFTSVSITDVLP